MKVYYLTNAPTPYKVAFWEELGKHCELIVLLEVEHSNRRDNSWKSDERTNFQEIVMPNLFRTATGAFCPCVTKYLKRKDGVVIINGYNNLTGMYSIIYSKIHNLPYIISADGGLLNQDSALTSGLKKLLINGAKGYLSSGVVTDEYLIHYGAEKRNIGRYPFTSISQSEVLDRPTTNKEKETIRNELGISERKVVISVGQFIHRKGIDVLLKACDGIDQDIGVYIIGGEATEAYNQIVNEYHLKSVHFLPFIQPVLLKKYYLAADIFVLPTREDIWGLVINEAMAYGLPVITTRRCVSGMEMIRDGDAGKLVDVEDVDGLRTAIKELLADDLQAISKKAIERANEYTIEKMALKTIEYISTFEKTELMEG